MLLIVPEYHQKISTSSKIIKQVPTTNLQWQLLHIFVEESKGMSSNGLTFDKINVTCEQHTNRCWGHFVTTFPSFVSSKQGELVNFHVVSRPLRITARQCLPPPRISTTNTPLEKEKFQKYRWSGECRTHPRLLLLSPLFHIHICPFNVPSIIQLWQGNDMSNSLKRLGVQL